jgi:hypothetical protein
LFTVEIDKNKPLLSIKEELLLMRSILLTNNAEVHSALPKTGTMLISIPNAFSAGKVAKSYKELIVKKVTANEAKMQLQPINKYFPRNECAHNIVYDDHNNPLYQFTISQWYNQDFHSALIDVGFRDVDGVLVFLSTVPLCQNKFSKLSENLETLFKKSQLECRHTSQTEQREVKNINNGINSSNKLEGKNEAQGDTNIEKRLNQGNRKQTGEIYTWVIGNETIRSGDPRVCRLSGLNYTAFMLFRLQTCSNKSGARINEKFSAKSKFVAGEYGDQGVKFYKRNDQL